MTATSHTDGASPQRYDIWEDLTPGYHRYVRVIRVGPSQALIERVEQSERGWKLPRRAPSRWTNLTRFNGKTSGFRLHERPELLTDDKQS